MLLLLAAVVTPRPTPPIRRTCCWLSLLGCSREWCPGSVRVRFRNLPFRHPALPSLSSAGARTEDESGSTSSPVGPWCAVCGGGRYRPASRSAHPGGRGAQIATTCTAPRCPPEGYGGSSRMLDLSPPSVGAKWVCVMCYPPRPTGRGGADDGFDGTRGVPWNRLTRHPGVLITDFLLLITYYMGTLGRTTAAQPTALPAREPAVHQRLPLEGGGGRRESTPS